MSDIYSRYPDFCMARNIYYIRDYIENFIEWYSKRTKYYISDQWLININARMRNKYGSDSARNGAKKLPFMNERFGIQSDGLYCRVSYYDLVPMNGSLCSVCGNAIDSMISKKGSFLSEYNSRFDIMTGKEIIPTLSFTLCINTLSFMHKRRSTNNQTGKACCSSLECNQIKNWMFERKKYLVSSLVPSKKIREKQYIKHRKSFLAARYLDFNARLKIAQNKNGQS